MCSRPSRRDGIRIYVCAFEAADGARTWLALDGEGEPVGERRDVRDAVSIAALCEVAEEAAFPGDLDELRAQLVALRVTEAPDGIQEAEDAARALQHVLGSAAARRLAGPARRDRAAARAARTGARPDGAVPVLDGHAERRRGRRLALERRRGRVPGPAWLTWGMEGGGFFPFGGDPEEILRGLRDFAEQQAEGVKEAQREQFATLTLSTAVDLTQAALAQVEPTGTSDEQAIQLRDAMRVLFPEAVALVSAARQGFMRE